MEKFVIRDREAGNIIDYFSTLKEAEAMLDEYEHQDKLDGVYTEDFYEIYDIEEGKIIY